MTTTPAELTAITSSIGAILSGVATSIAIIVAYRVHKNQKLLSQRQLLLPLWDHMSTLKKIDHNKPIIPDIIKNVNTLELVALCCEGGMIDEKVVKRTFRDQFINHYEDIEKFSSIPELNKSGKELLKENKAAIQFYNALIQEQLNQDKVTKA